MLVLGHHGEGLLDDVVAAHVEQVRALQQHVGDHQDDQIVGVFLLLLLHDGHKLVLAFQQTLGIHAGDLADADVLTGDVELLVVGLEQFLGALAVGAAGGKQFLAQFVQGDVGDAAEPLGHGDVPLGAGGGLEHDGVRQDGAGHKARHLGGGYHAVFLVHGGDDGVGAAHRLVAHMDGLAGLDIRQAVVVDDLQDVYLLQTGDGLGDLVVIHQNHLLAAGTQQMITGERAHHLLVLVHDRVAAVAAFEHLLLHVVHIVAQMEIGDVLALADPGHRQGQVDHPGDAAGAERRGNDTGVPGLGPLRLDVRPADDQAADAGLNGPVDQLRLIAADQDAFRIDEGGILVVLRDGDEQLTGDAAGLGAVLVDKGTLQHADQIEQRNLLDAVFIHGLHLIGGQVPGGEHAVQMPVVVHDGDHVQRLVPHGLPGQTHGDGPVESGGLVIVQVVDLGAHVLDPERRFHPKMIQQALGLVIDAAQAHSLIFPIAQGVAQMRVGHGGYDGVGIRVAVPGHIDFTHRRTLPIGKIIAIIRNKNRNCKPGMRKKGRKPLTQLWLFRKGGIW